MRIVGGAWRGRGLAGPGALKGVRPTSDRVREALFSILIARGVPLEGARVLDIFAGTGALGLEALSRGAQKAVFIEKSGQTRKLLARNIAALGAAGVILPQDATRLGRAGGAFDICFCDPPYGKGLGEAAIVSALRGGWLEPNAMVVLEEAAEVRWPEGISSLDARRYGDTVLNFGSVL